MEKMVRNMKDIYRIYPKDVWVLTFIMFLFVCRKTLFNVRREVGDYSTSVDTNSIWAMLGICFTAYYIFKHRNVAIHVIKGLSPLLLYYVFAWLSFMWADSFTTITFKSLENIANIMLVGMIVYYIPDWKRLLYYVMLISTIIIYMDVLPHIIAVGFRNYHTNAYTILAFIVFLIALGCIRNKIFTVKEMKWFLFLSLYAWITGTSTASYISGLIGAVLLYSSGKRGMNIVRGTIVCIILYFLYIVAEDQIYSFIAAGHSRDALETGTGRDILWEAALNNWSKSPWLGSGYIVGESGLGGSKQISSHNSFISVLVNTGIIGALIFGWFIVKGIYISYKTSRISIYGAILFPIWIAVFINLNSCPVLASHWSYVTNPVVMIIAAILMKLGNKKRFIRKRPKLGYGQIWLR